MDTTEEARQLIFKTELAEFPGAFDMTILSDPTHKVVDAYGIYNPEEEAAKPGIPYPVTYIIDKNGVVVKRFIDPVNYIRPENEDLRPELVRVGAIRDLIPMR